MPVVLHILATITYCLLGAFQFAAGFRRRWPGSHRAAGRLLVAAGLVAALSGQWVATQYAIVPDDSALLHGLRQLFGSAMALAIVGGCRVILRRDVARHQAWMRRACAIGLGAGTQALIRILPLLIIGEPGD